MSMMREKRLLLEVDSENKKQRILLRSITSEEASSIQNTSIEWFDSLGEEEVNIDVSDEITSDEIMDFEKVDWFDSIDKDDKDIEVMRTGLKDENEDTTVKEEESTVQKNIFMKIKDLPVMITDKNNLPEIITEKNNCAKLDHEKLLAHQYRMLAKSKTPAKFQLVSSNVYPTCACQGTKNGCKTKVCSCIWFGQECQDTCGCKDNCPNKELTRGEGKRHRIGTSGVHGAGCFAEEDIGKGVYVGEYLGEIVARFDQDRKKNQSKFLMETGDKDYLLDASRFGSELAKMNHRMGANCEFRMKRVAGQWRVGVWALKDIAEGDELFANYGHRYRGHGLITPYVNKSTFLHCL